MRPIRPTAAVIAFAACLAFACNALTGVDELEANGIPDGGSSFGDGSTSVADGQSTETGTTSSSSSSSGSASSSSGIAVSCTSIGGKCSPLAPPGWKGPYLVYDGSNPAAPKACPPQLEDTFTLGAGTPSGGFTCPGCKCQGVTGAVCTATLSIFTDPACGAIAATVVDPSTCYLNSATSSVGATFKHSVTVTGKCDPALNGAPQRGPIAWSSNYLFCGSKTLTAIGCDTTDQVCLPPTEGAKVCIVQDGASSCPSGWNSAPGIAVFGGTNDTRSCDVSTCSCNTPTGLSCSGTYRSSPKTDCSAPILPPFATSRAVETCFSLDPSYSAKTVTGPTASGGSCAPTGTPKSVGSLTANAPALTCCLP